MTREQKLEAALRRIENLALDDMLDLVGGIAREAIDTPPDVSWEDRPDELTAAIDKAHPHHTKDYKTYTKALELVSNRHSKGALVGLVNYLLSQVPAADTRDVTPAMLRGAIGRAWCHEENAAKEFDVDLADAVLWEISAIIEGKDHG